MESGRNESIFGRSAEEQLEQNFCNPAPIMSSIDEEVRRAERMALAVASAPNMTSKKAKKTKKRLTEESSVRFKNSEIKSHQQRLSVDKPMSSNRQRLDSDEEVRRAREMA